jgi:dipeptidyl aminopeptidase/acylaminoacyl peptidase
MTAEGTVTRDTTTAGGKRPITIEDLFRVKMIGDPRPSPDGSRIAYVVTQMDTDEDTYRSQIWLVPAAGGTPIRYTGGKNDSSPRWSPDGKRLAFISRRDDGTPEGKKKARPEVWVLDTDGGEAWQLTKTKHGAADPTWSPDGRFLAYTTRIGGAEDEEGEERGAKSEERGEKGEGEKKAKKSDVKVITEIRYKADGIHHLLVGRGYRHIFVVEVPEAAGEPREGRQLTFGDWDDAAPAWSPDGQRIAFCANTTPDRDFNNHTDLWVVPVVAGEPRKLTATQGPSALPAWSPDGATIAFLGHVNPEPYRRYANMDVWTVPADGAGAPRNLTEAFDHTFAGDVAGDLRSGLVAQPPLWSPDGRALYATAIERGTEHLFRLDPTGGGEPTRIIAGERGVMNAALGADGRIIFTAASVLNPGDLFSCALDGSDERQLTDLNKDLFDEVALSDAERFTYAGDGGWPIDGWLMKPCGFSEGGRYPLVLEIHGGPAAQYGFAFFHEFQLLAAQGYGVLFTNPRGSTGKGAAFTIANRSRWGEEDYRDIMAGVDAAIAANAWIDPTRLGVGGGSFGGFMTNWIVGHTDRFKAAVTMRCVSNLMSFFGTSDIGFTFLEMQFETEPWEDLEKLLRHSPITYVKNIHTPLLILHSEEDYRCPIEQGEQMFIALKKLGRTTEFVRFPDEDHNLSRGGKPAHRAERLRHILRWFETYL